MTGSSGSSSRPRKPRSARSPEVGLPRLRCDLVVAGRGDLAGAARSGSGDPQRVASLVGQSERQQTVGLVLPAVVRPVLVPGASAGADQGPVQEHDKATLAGELLQRSIQPRGTRCQQADHLQDPAAHGGCGHVVTARQIGKPLVMAEDGEDDQSDRPGDSLRQRERISSGRHGSGPSPGSACCSKGRADTGRQARQAIYSISEGHRTWVDSLPDFLVPVAVEEEGEPVTTSPTFPIFRHTSLTCRAPVNG